MLKLNLSDGENLSYRTSWYNNPWTRGAYETYITLWGDHQGLKGHDPITVPLKNSQGRQVRFFSTGASVTDWKCVN